MDFDVIGKFTVIMADPPWDIHMELPYGTMTDDEMKKMGIEKVQVGIKRQLVPGGRTSSFESKEWAINVADFYLV